MGMVQAISSEALSEIGAEYEAKRQGAETNTTRAPGESNLRRIS